MKRQAVFLLVSLASLLAIGCKKKIEEEPKGPEIPHGQVWLTKQQVLEAEIKTVVAAEQDVDDTISTSGKVTFDDLKVAHVYSPVNGKVMDIFAPLGTKVKQGEILATIRSPDTGTARADVRKAEADLLAAEHDFRREKTLAALGSGNTKDLEAAEDRYRIALAELDRARQKAHHLNNAGDSYPVRSPIAGEVIMRGVNPGVEVQGTLGGGTVVELFTIGQLDQVWVLADVYEMDLARVKVGSPAVVTTVAFKDMVFKGNVNWVSGMLDPTTRTEKIKLTFANPCLDGTTPQAAMHAAASAAPPRPPVPAPSASAVPAPAPTPAPHTSAPPQASASAAPVTIGAPSPKPKECQNWMLKPEMYATAKISVEQRHTLAIPRNSILHLGEQTVVFVELGEQDGMVRFERIPVWVDEGESSDFMVVGTPPPPKDGSKADLVIERGLKIGQKVVTSGAIKLAANLAANLQ